MEKICIICGRPFWVTWKRKVLTSTTCSFKCKTIRISRTRKKTIKHSCGYLLAFMPSHPFANIDGYVPEHRLVVEKQIGRIINPSIENVHHINKIRSDNHIENLILVPIEDHRKLDHNWYKIDGEWWRPCAGCNKSMPLKDNFYFRKNGLMISKCKTCNLAAGMNAYWKRKSAS